MPSKNKDVAKLTTLKYQRKRYFLSPQFKKKITAINKKYRQITQKETKEKASSHFSKWNKKDKEILKEFCKKLSNRELAIVLGRTYDSVRQKKRRVGIRRNKSWLGKY